MFCFQTNWEVTKKIDANWKREKNLKVWQGTTTLMPGNLFLRFKKIVKKKKNDDAP